MLDVRKLRYFATVAELGSFTRAAAALHIAQPALSRQVQQLEQEIGMDLLIRAGRKIQITDAGTAMLRHARTIDRDFERMVEDMQARKDTPVGTVVFGIPPSLAESVVPRVVARVKGDLPMITLKVVEGLTPVLADWIRDNKADLAILSLAMMSDADELPNLLVSPLVSEDMVLAEPTGGHPVPPYYEPADLNERPLVLSEMLASIVRRQLPDSDCLFRFDVDIDSVQAIKTMVLRGEASTILPISMLSEEIAQGSVSASGITPGAIRRQLVLAQPNYRQMTQAAEALKRSVQTLLSEMSKQGLFTLEKTTNAAAGASRGTG